MMANIQSMAMKYFKYGLGRFGWKISWTFEREREITRESERSREGYVVWFGV